VLPEVLRTYQNHHLDSKRWDYFIPRAGDIVISTSLKSGTTLTQEIVGHLIFKDQEESDWHKSLATDLSPWLDYRVPLLDEVVAQLEAQNHRRFIKSHLALDGLPYYPQVEYIVVARDPRDVFMSFWNHYSHYTPESYRELNETADRVGAPIPLCPTDIHETWRNWITRGWFEWESEGYPFWGNMHHSQSWWNYRHLDNVHLVHYADLLNDLASEIRHIADFLEIEITDEEIAAFLPNLTLDAMRGLVQRSGDWQQSFQGGAQTFFFKGTNGRWKEVLTAEELALYEEATTRVLTPDCRMWVEEGRVALG